PFEERVVYDENLRQNVPARNKVAQISEEYKSFTELTDEDRQTALQGIDDEIAGRGFYNTVKSTISGLTNMLPKWLGGTTVENNQPLAEEIKEVRSSMGDEKLSETEILERAKDIKLQKRLSEAKQAKTNSFLQDLPQQDKELLFSDTIDKLKTVNESDKNLLKTTELQKA